MHFSLAFLRVQDNKQYTNFGTLLRQYTKRITSKDLWLMYIKTHDFMSDVAMRIVNAQKAHHLVIDLPRTAFVLSFINLLFIEGFIKGYQVVHNTKKHQPTSINNVDPMKAYNARNNLMFTCYKEVDTSQQCVLKEKTGSAQAPFLDVIRVYLKYKNGTPAINNIHRCSKQSRRYYLTCKNIFLLKKREPRSTYVISSSSGLLADYKAIEHQVGGELLFCIL
jgi:ribosomal protein S8